jgi:hypothetical protein
MFPIAQTRRNLAKLLATGQTTSYGSGTGVDDGALKKGIVKRYVVTAPGTTTNITINSKTDVHTNNTVFDTHTELTWSQVGSASVGPTSDGKLPWTTTGSGGTAEGIFPYVAAANAATLGGFSDWRIPNYFELLSLMDCEAPTSLPDATAFPSWINTVAYWSSTTRSTSTTRAFSVDFIDNTTTPSQNKTATFLCILVRG